MYPLEDGMSASRTTSDSPKRSVDGHSNSTWRGSTCGEGVRAGNAVVSWVGEVSLGVGVGSGTFDGSYEAGGETGVAAAHDAKKITLKSKRLTINDLRA